MSIALFAMPTLTQSANIFNVVPMVKGIEVSTYTAEQVCGDTSSAVLNLSEKDTLVAKTTMYFGDLIGFEADATISFSNVACK
jgi:hypothetical protein